MSLDIETAKNYVGSVLERTIGINATRRWQRFMGSEELILYDPPNKIGKYTNRITVQLFQIALPVFTESLPGIGQSIARVFTGSPDNPLSFSTRVVIPMEIDIATWALILNGNEMWQIIALKLAANAATHVGLDIIGAAARRIRTLKPSISTLL